jgi:hypothetical protein
MMFPNPLGLNDGIFSGLVLHSAYKTPANFSEFRAAAGRPLLATALQINFAQRYCETPHLP